MCDTLFYVGDQEYKPPNIIDILANICNNIKRKVNGNYYNPYNTFAPYRARFTYRQYPISRLRRDYHVS